MGDSYVNTTGTRKLEDGRWRHTFSQSMIGTFQKCPEQARATYFREVRSEQTDSSCLGTGCHEAFEYLCFEKKAGREPDLGEAIAVARMALDEMGPWKYTKFSRDTVYDMVPTLVKGFIDGILPHVDPAEMEKRFSVQLYSGKHREIWLNGTIDCIDDAGNVWDWKTASQPYEKWEKQRWAVQPTVYCYALQQLEPDRCYGEGLSSPPATGEMHYDVFTYGVVNHDGTPQLLQIERDQTHLDWLKEMCAQIAWMIENDVKPWPYNDSGWWCGPKWCPKFADCKGRFIEERWAA